MSFWDDQKSNQRKGPDFMLQFIRVACVFAWILLAVFIFITDLARPEKATLFDHLFDINVRSTWHEGLLLTSFILAFVLFVFSLIGLIMNAKRLKRKTDRIRLSLVITLICALVYMAIYSYFTFFPF